MSRKLDSLAESNQEAICRTALEAARAVAGDDSMRSTELQQIVRQRGWPRRFRSLLWLKYSGAQKRMQGKQGYYSKLIKRDIPDECGPRQVSSKQFENFPRR